MNKFKLIASDLDGTLLTSEKEISPMAKTIINRYINDGGIFVPCTGRAYNAIHEWLRKHEGIRYYISTNGATVYDSKEDKILKSFGVSYDILVDVLKMVSNDASVEIILNGTMYTEKLIDIYDYHVEDYFRYHYHKTRVETESLTKLAGESKFPIEKLHVICKYANEQELLVSKISAKYPHLSVYKGPAKCVEITDERATKGDGLKFLAEHLNINLDEVLCFGDQFNDISMTKYFKYSVAMDNAIDELKAEANYLTCNNDDDGVAKKIQEFLNY